MGWFSKQVDDKDLYGYFIQQCALTHRVYSQTSKFYNLNDGGVEPKDKNEANNYWELYKKYDFIIEGRTQDVLSQLNLKTDSRQGSLLQFACELIRDAMFEKNKKNHISSKTVRNHIKTLVNLTEKDPNNSIQGSAWKDPSIEALREELSRYGCVFKY